MCGSIGLAAKGLKMKKPPRIPGAGSKIRPMKTRHFGDSKRPVK